MHFSVDWNLKVISNMSNLLNLHISDSRQNKVRNKWCHLGYKLVGSHVLNRNNCCCSPNWYPGWEKKKKKVDVDWWLLYFLHLYNQDICVCVLHFLKIRILNFGLDLQSDFSPYWRQIGHNWLQKSLVFLCCSVGTKGKSASCTCYSY